MTEAVFLVGTRSGSRQVRLSSCLDAARQEAAVCEAHDWIKALRHAVVDGQPLRRRFTFRGDSLWWFAEIYLHKQQVVLDLFQTIAALEALIARDSPDALELVSGSRLVGLLAPQLAAAHRVRYRGTPPSAASWRVRLTSLDAKAGSLYAAAVASRLRPRRSSARPDHPGVTAFVHRAFWRADGGDGSAEAYIGPVLKELEHRVGPGGLTYVGVGPAFNFRARRWWHPLGVQHGDAPARAIEGYAPLDRLRPSRAVFRDRHEMRRALWRSDDLRQRAIIGRCDCWPVIRHELAGIALLQWPWSARSMDEAAAALDRLQPRATVTYAEAGGWGRALMLECRRRGIPAIGIQHGFIYRHWLNYLHEADEMTVDPGNPLDRGFPRPTLTLLFDEHAAVHLTEAGRFPREALLVSGSPRLDALVASARTLTAADIDRARAAAGGSQEHLVLVATKHREARDVLPALVEAAARIPGARVAIKTHPAETPDVYRGIVRDWMHVTVLPAAAPLAPLLLASRAVVTVNSTVALDAAVLDVPALVIGLPNNLSPFVEAGAMAGAAGTGVGPVLRQILYDEEFRQQLSLGRRAFLARFGIVSDGRAAERAAEAVLKAASRPG